MRIGLIIGQIRKVGGMEKQAILLARELDRREIDVTLFISGVMRKAASLDLGSIRHRYLYYTKYSGWLSDLVMKSLFRARPLTHIVAFNAFNAVRALEAGLDCPITLSVRGTRFASDPSMRNEYMHAAARCSNIVTNSRNTAELIESSGIAEGKNVAVIHNGIALPAEASRPEGKTVLWVGSMKDVKDPMTFLEACLRLIRDDAEIRVVMAGEGPSRPRIEKYLAEKGLTGNFTLPGEITYDEIPYRTASVFVNSSIRESSSNSLLEALSFGIPAVATDNHGNRDVLQELGIHRLVPKSDPEAMAIAVRELLDIGSDTRSRISEESRRYIEDRYSVRRMVDGYIRLFGG